MSLVSPLATVEWETSRLLRDAPEKERNNLQSAVLRGNLYVAVSHKPLRQYEQVGTLFRISAEDLSSWEQLPPLPSAFSGLATYRSHLVLVGGVDLSASQGERPMATDKVWCSPDGVRPWQSSAVLSIPLMPKTEYCPAVVSIGSGGTPAVVAVAAAAVESVGSGGTPPAAVASVGSGGTPLVAAAVAVASVGSGGTPPAAAAAVTSVGSGGTPPAAAEAVASVGSGVTPPATAAECLVVVGEDEDTWLSSVTVFTGQQWACVRGFLAEGLSSDVTCTCLNGNLYIAACCTVSSEPANDSIFWCGVRELLKECEKEEEEEEEEGSESLWHRLALPELSGGRSGSVLYDLVSVVGEHLVVTCRNLRGSGSVYAFSYLTQTWAKVGDLVDDGFGGASRTPTDMTITVSSQGELLVARDRGDLTIFKGSFHLPPYYPDKKIDMSSLSRLELAGIQVMQPIAEQLLSLGFAPKPLTEEGGANAPTTTLDHESLVSKWLVECKVVTWKALFEYMRDTLCLEELAQQIEDYISCVRSLKELCVHGIMSALLKRQEILEPELLQSQLPGYLSPLLRGILINRYRAITRHS